MTAETIEGLEELDSETKEVFRKKCPWHPEYNSCKECPISYRCIFYVEEE